MRRRGKGERGSVLLMIMLAVAVAGILFSALYLALSSSHRQAMEHELQVQAEFDAQKMMEIALYHFYRQEDFEGKFTGEGHCLEDADDKQDKVCLTIETDSEGVYTKELLTATGVSSSHGQVAEQTRVIQLDLLAMDGGGATDTGPALPERLPTGEVPEDAKPSVGQSCFNSGDQLPVRALAIDTDLDLTDGSPSKTIQIEGGLYIPEGRRIVLPDKVDHKFVHVNGLIFQADNLIDENNGPVKPEPSVLGESALRDTLCQNAPSFHDKVNEIADRAIRQNQKVPVYIFESADGVVTLDAAGKRKEAMYQQFFDQPGVTLRQVLEGSDEKIIVVKGKLVLNEPLQKSRGYLVVDQDGESGTASIEVPSGFAWKHYGGILTDAVAWPDQYKLSILLSKGQVKLYDQSIDW
ncbi:MAG: hypothetical protein WCC10_10780 [Tumebacillaceae bacterium]